MQLSKNYKGKSQAEIEIKLPEADSYNLPEKVLQFGTGVLLRGLPDYFIDKANKQHVFNGRIVMIKSTNRGDIKGLKKQDNLYTVCVRGLKRGEVIEEYYLNNAISRILQANDEWEEVLKCASNESIRIVISNTTEVGIQLVDDDIYANPPASFPGKLLSFLYARYKAFQGDKTKGLVIIPTELIVDNGDKLKEIVLQLSERNKLPADFMHWLQSYNTFCNSLVDRIVPGKPSAQEQDKIGQLLGHEDNYIIEAEPYKLWAIETPSEEIKQVLSFAQADDGVILTGDISKYRKLKLRLLNGTHTFSCGLAFLSGLDTVRKATEDNEMRKFIQDLMQEIADTIVDDLISTADAQAFAKDVFDRFSNPYIIHRWLSISLQYSSKMEMRNVPLIINFYKKFNTTPKNMAKGFAAYLRFMRSEKAPDGTFEGEFKGRKYTIQDDRAETLFNWWKQFPDDPVEAILSDASLWSVDLTQFPGFAEKVKKDLQSFSSI